MNPDPLRNTCEAPAQSEEEAAAEEAEEAAEAAEEDEEDILERARRRFAEQAASDELRGGEPTSTCLHEYMMT